MEVIALLLVTVAFFIIGIVGICVSIYTIVDMIDNGDYALACLMIACVIVIVLALVALGILVAGALL